MPTGTVTPETLFDTVEMPPAAKVLRRTALIFAGRIPIDAEFAPAQQGGAALRATTVGIVHNWSGQNSEGYLTTTALLAALNASALPVLYLSFGGFSATSGLTRFTRIDNAQLLRDIANPASNMFSETDCAAVASNRAATAERFEAVPNRLPGDLRHRAFYRSAFATEGLKAYADAIPPEDELKQEA